VEGGTRAKNYSNSPCIWPFEGYGHGGSSLAECAGLVDTIRASLRDRARVLARPAEIRRTSASRTTNGGSHPPAVTKNKAPTLGREGFIFGGLGRNVPVSLRRSGHRYATALAYSRVQPKSTGLRLVEPQTAVSSTRSHKNKAPTLGREGFIFGGLGRNVPVSLRRSGHRYATALAYSRVQPKSTGLRLVEPQTAVLIHPQSQKQSPHAWA
jgi:hypothetical protein